MVLVNNVDHSHRNLETKPIFCSGDYFNILSQFLKWSLKTSYGTMLSAFGKQNSDIKMWGQLNWLSFLSFLLTNWNRRLKFDFKMTQKCIPLEILMFVNCSKWLLLKFSRIDWNCFLKNDPKVLWKSNLHFRSSFFRPIFYKNSEFKSSQIDWTEVNFAHLKIAWIRFSPIYKFSEKLSSDPSFLFPIYEIFPFSFLEHIHTFS